jgi:hypothetical protein
VRELGVRRGAAALPPPSGVVCFAGARPAVLASVAMAAGSAPALCDLRGRRWADVADEEDAAEAAALREVARCGAPELPTLADFLAVARHVSSPRRTLLRRAAASSSPRSAPPRLAGRPSLGSGSLPAGSGAGLLCGAASGPPEVACSAAPALGLSGAAALPVAFLREGWGIPGVGFGPSALQMGRSRILGPRPILGWRSQDARVPGVGRLGRMTGSEAQCDHRPKPIGAWLWLHKGASSLDEGSPASPEDSRRHRSDAGLVRRAAPPPPLRMTYAATAAGSQKRDRSRSPFPRRRPRSPPRQAPPAAARPSGAAPPYRPPARRSPARSRSPRAARDPRPRHGQGRQGSPPRAVRHARDLQARGEGDRRSPAA